VKAQAAQGNPYLLNVLEQYRAYLASVHREPEASLIAQEETQLQGVQQTNCSNCTVSVYGLRAH
jgi:hypothetical protein